jgi:hypothetical protein
MGKAFRTVDRIAGRIYTRALAIVLGAIAAILLGAGVLLLWFSGGHPFGLAWLAGGLLFGLVARASWRSRAPLSEVDSAG